MRTVLLFLFIFILVSTPIARAERKVSFGIELGGNLNWGRWDPGPLFGDLKPGLSFNVGGMLDIDISKNFGIEIDLLYSNVKTKWEYSDILEGIPVDSTRVWTLGTLSMPILAKVKFPSARVTPFLGVGPELGYILSHKEKLKLTVAGETVKETTDIMDSTTAVNFAITLCAGLNINLHQIKLVPELRFSLGLTDFYKTEGLSRKNSQLLLFLGLKF